jgi:hypothetical protein
MKVVANLVGDIARDEFCGPFRLEFATEQFQRREAFKLSVAGGALEGARMALGEFGGDVAGQGVEAGTGERVERRPFLVEKP